MNKILVLLSGGLDSVTLAAKLKREGKDVEGLFIDRGQSNAEREREAVNYFKGVLDIPVRETSLRDWRASWYKKDGVSDKELPRNAVFVLAALPFSHEAECDEIALGSNLDDTSVPDGSVKVVDAINALLQATEQPERLIAPFLDASLDKAGVASLALELLGEEGVERTWSCWRGQEKPCGQCTACGSRKHALDAASMSCKAG